MKKRCDICQTKNNKNAERCKCCGQLFNDINLFHEPSEDIEFINNLSSAASEFGIAFVDLNSSILNLKEAGKLTLEIKEK